MLDNATIKIVLKPEEYEKFCRIAKRVGMKPDMLGQKLLIERLIKEAGEQEILAYLKNRRGYYVAYDIIASDLGIPKDEVWGLLYNLEKHGKIKQHDSQPNFSIGDDHDGRP